MTRDHTLFVKDILDAIRAIEKFIPPEETSDRYARPKAQRNSQ